MMNSKLSFSSYAVIGVMLFALFFGAGNLIFPAQLGQNAGENLWPAVLGFLITGVGLPFLGVLAMGYSGSSNLQELASRVHPTYAIFFTSLLYLTIGPFFAAPRTGTVAFEIGVTTFVPEGYEQVGLFMFTLIFFGISLWLSLNPSKIVNRVGKILSPGIIILLGALLIMVVVNPMGSFGAAQDGYIEGALMKGFIEGYNTMDALAALVFGIIVINAIKALGVTSKKEILSASMKSGLVAVLFLALIYVGIAYLGAVSTEKFGIFDTGGPVLSSASEYYLGTIGSVLLAVIIILACLTTSIGLITACGEYFHTLIPMFSYKAFVVFFSLLSFVIGNFGLANIIDYSVPVLMFLYPLAVTLMLLTFLSPLFHHAKVVYVSATVIAFLIGIIDGLKTLCGTLEIEYFGWLQTIVSFYEKVLPLYNEGLGWLLPVLITVAVTSIIARFQKVSTVEV